MTTHPPGQPDGPTGPGRAIPAGPTLDEADEILNLHHDRIGEPNEFSRPPLPRLGEWVRDLERLLTQALAVVDREPDARSLPGGNVFEICQAMVGLHIEAALRDLAKIAEQAVPPVGSAVKLPVAAGKEPTPGSAAALSGAARESTGAVVAPGAGPSSDPSPGSGTPVSPPARGVGPGVLGHVIDTLPALLLFALAAKSVEGSQ